jgi:hypothetical protein
MRPYNAANIFEKILNTFEDEKNNSITLLKAKGWDNGAFIEFWKVWIKKMKH